MFTVTYYRYSSILKKGFSETLTSESLANIRLYAMALNLQVVKVIDTTGTEVSIKTVWADYS